MTEEEERALELVEKYDLLDNVQEAIEELGSDDLVAYFDESTPFEIRFSDRQDFIDSCIEDGVTPFPGLQKSARETLGDDSWSAICLWMIITPLEGGMIFITLGCIPESGMSFNGKLLSPGGDA